MLNQHLFKAILSVHFSGADSRQPLQSALCRIGLGVGAGLFFGVTIAKGIARAILPYGFPTYLIFTLSLAIGFVVGGLVCLALSSIGRYGRKSGLRGILSTLSISRASIWLAIETPMLIVLSLVGMFGGILIYALASAMLASHAVALVGWLLGLFCGYGCLLVDGSGKRLSNIGLFVGIVILVGGIFDRILANSSGYLINYLLLVINFLLVLPLLGHWQLYMSGGSSAVRGSKYIDQPLLPGRIPYSAWYLVKLLRNKRTKTSFIIALSLSASGAISIILRQHSFSDPFQLLFFGAVLSATFACDVRGIMIKYCPPESVVLSGVRDLVKSEVISVGLLSLLVGAPMFVALSLGASNWLLFTMMFTSVQIFASCIGLLASTVFVPKSSDTGSQFMAAVFAISVLFLLPKYGGFSDSSYTVQVIFWLVSSVIVVFGSFVLEIIRRKNYGGA